MSSRRTSGQVVVADAHNAPRASSQRDKKKTGTPVFLYLIPIVPILFTILMSGKSGDQDASFGAPPQQQALRSAPVQQQAQPKVIVPEIAVKQQLVAVQPPQEEEKEDKPEEKRSAAAGGDSSNPLGLELLKQDTLVSAQNTVVTGYFTLKSKYAKEEYIKWMSNMLSLQDAMVIFTSPAMVETIQGLRSHAKDRTVIIPLDLSQLELVKLYDEKFWQAQLDKDPEKRIHKSYELFWIWLSKSFFVKTAIDLNLYGSDVYMWSDIGCFRNGRYRDKEMIVQRQLIPRDRIFQMAHHEPQPPPYIWWNDKYNQKPLFYHSGSQMIGYKDTWRTFHAAFLETITGFIQRDLFIGEDQTVLQSTCLRIPTLCAYVPMTQIGDNHYFGLRHLLHYGTPVAPAKEYTYWYPPAGLTAERADVTDKSLLEPMKPPPPPGRDKIRAA